MQSLLAAFGKILADAIARIVGDWRRDRGIKGQGKQEAVNDAQIEAKSRAIRAARAVDAQRHGGSYAGRVRDRFTRD